MADYTHLSNINVQGYVTSSGQGTLLGSFETMPAASAQNAGQIVLYTGATNSTYTKGKYYKSNGSGWSEYDAGQVSAGVLEGYVPKDGSKVLSTNDYTTNEKNKLAGIATGAQVNVIEKVNVTNASGVTSALPVTNKGVTVDLSTLATKSDVSAIPKFAVTLVDTLPASGNASTIYLKSNGGASGNSYDEYLYYNNAWEKIGSTDVDLTAYAKTEDVNAALAGKQGTITAGTGISKSGDTLSLATSGVTAGSKGSTTQVPVITVDQYGRVTSLSSSNIYPPTTAGTNGQYWKSDGSGTGVWETLDTTPTSGSTKAITSGAVYSAINTTNSNVTALQNTVAGKQDKLTFDSTPTSGSSNPVTSGGVYTAINAISPDFSCTIIPTIEIYGSNKSYVICRLNTTSSVLSKKAYPTSGGTSVKVYGPIYDSTKSCSITYVYQIYNEMGLESYTNTCYPPKYIENSAGIIARGTGSIRIYVSYLIADSLSSTRNAFSLDSTTLPYIQYNIKDGVLESISSNMCLPDYNNSWYVFYQGIISIEIV